MLRDIFQTTSTPTTLETASKTVSPVSVFLAISHEPRSSRSLRSSSVRTTTSFPFSVLLVLTFLLSFGGRGIIERCSCQHVELKQSTNTDSPIRENPPNEETIGSSSTSSSPQDSPNSLPALNVEDIAATVSFLLDGELLGSVQQLFEDNYPKHSQQDKRGKQQQPVLREFLGKPASSANSTTPRLLLQLFGELKSVLLGIGDTADKKGEDAAQTLGDLLRLLENVLWHPKLLLDLLSHVGTVDFVVPLLQQCENLINGIRQSEKNKYDSPSKSDDPNGDDRRILLERLPTIAEIIEIIKKLIQHQDFVDLSTNDFGGDIFTSNPMKQTFADATSSDAKMPQQKQYEFQNHVV